MTEDEAKLKCCPLGKMRASYDANWDKGSCIGSHCMMWSFSEDQTEEKSTCLEVLGEVKDPIGEAPRPDGEGWTTDGGMRRSEGFLYKPNRSEGGYVGKLDGPFTMFWQKWERPRAPEKREGDCSLTL